MARTRPTKTKSHKIAPAKLRSRSQPSARVSRPDETAQFVSEFVVGARVEHKSFGEGKLLVVHDEKLTIQFKTAGEKEILKDFVTRRR